MVIADCTADHLQSNNIFYTNSFHTGKSFEDALTVEDRISDTLCQLLHHHYV